MKRILIAFVALPLCAPLLRAQSVSFLNINTDPAAVGMANAGVAMTADAYALENNMAATALEGPKMAASVGYALWQPKVAGTRMLSVAGFYQLSSRFAAGLLYKNMSYPAYDIIGNEGRSNGTFTPSEYAFAAGFAYEIMDGLAAGLTLRFLSSSLTDAARASAFGADISVKYQREGFQAGLSVNNLGSQVNYGGESYAQPGLVRAGAAYSVAGFTASAEADYLFAGALMAAVGLEYNIAEIVSLRGGFHYGDAAKAIPTYASLGLGVQFAGVHLDAAFLLGSKTLGNTMLFGLGYAF